MEDNGEHLRGLLHSLELISGGSVDAYVAKTVQYSKQIATTDGEVVSKSELHFALMKGLPRDWDITSALSRPF